jgi:hypothetical protein
MVLSSFHPEYWPPMKIVHELQSRKPDIVGD